MALVKNLWLIVSVNSLEERSSCFVKAIDHTFSFSPELTTKTLFTINYNQLSYVPFAILLTQNGMLSDSELQLILNPINIFLLISSFDFLFF